MASDTREQLLDNAEALFAEPGFYGASIAAIANELGLTKQALLHHFGSKEKLYGEVLKRISVRFDDLSKGEELAAFDPIASLQAYLLQLHNPTTLSPNATRLLMRELLDNKRRVDTAGTWYLKAFLEGLIAKVKAIPNWHNATDAEALAVVYQLLGAINYYGVSTPTLTGIFGEDGYAALDQAFPKQLKRLINAALTAR